MNAFSYWEGSEQIVHTICQKSIFNIFDSSFITVNNKTISRYIKVPDFIRDSSHLGFKSDYIRAALLHKYGGWWFDSDILLINSPKSLIEDQNAMIWSENKNGIFGLPNLCCGVLYSKPQSKFLEIVLEGLLSSKRTLSEWTAGQDVYSVSAYSNRNSVTILGYEDFYPILPEQWFLAWQPSYKEINMHFGLHLYTSKIRRLKNDELNLANKILNLKTIVDLHNEFLHSLFYNLAKSCNTL